MNIKINRSKDIKSALEYNFSKCDMSVGEFRRSDSEKYDELSLAGKLPSGQIAKIIDHNLPPLFDNLERSSTYLQKVADRAENDVTLVCSHIKISLHPDDTVDEEQFAKIGEEVLIELGYDDNPFLMFQHLDEPHSHIHLVTTTVKKDGSHVTSSYEGIKSNKIEERLEDKYDLISKRSKTREVEGVKSRSWKEEKIAEKTGHDSLKNVIRNAIKDSFDENMNSLDLFAQSLNRAGIGLHISKFKAKDQQTKYGFSYTLDPKKMKFNFSDSTNSLTSEFRGTTIPEDLHTNYVNQKTKGFMIEKGENKGEYNFSTNFFNEVVITDAPLVHPPLSDLKKMSMKGNDVGSGFTFYGLQNQLHFTDIDAEIYRDFGNDNSIEEPPEQSKLLYAMQREKIPCVVEALEEGASLSKVPEKEKSFYLDNYPQYWKHILQQETELREKNLRNSIKPQKALNQAKNRITGRE